MKLYFARHGETQSNLQKSVVSVHDELTDNGRKQAQQLAERISAISVDIIITSPHKRAEETAEIIAKKINREVLRNPFLREKKWPSEIEGKLLKEPEAERFFELSREKKNTEPAWHYSDEENFIDVKKRAVLFLEDISKLAYANILAVSHEYVIKMIVATMMHGDQLPYEIFRNFFAFTSLNNASLTLCEREKDDWKLITLNDQHHLN